MKSIKLSSLSHASLSGFNCNNFLRSLRGVRLSSELAAETNAVSDPGNPEVLQCNAAGSLSSSSLLQVYLPSFMFVVTSWVSFLIKPEVVPGRMALLVTLFLVLINIFNSVRLIKLFHIIS